jgi:hypothetical protein
LNENTPVATPNNAATVRHRTDQTKGTRGSRATLIALVYKLGMSAQTNWQRLRGLRLLGELLAGVKFVDGVHAVYMRGRARTQKRAFSRSPLEQLIMHKIIHKIRI